MGLIGVQNKNKQPGSVGMSKRDSQQSIVFEKIIRESEYFSVVSTPQIGNGTVGLSVEVEDAGQTGSVIVDNRGRGKFMTSARARLVGQQLSLYPYDLTRLSTNKMPV